MLTVEAQDKWVCSVLSGALNLTIVGAGHNKEVTGQKMTAFTAGVWTALREYAPSNSNFLYTLDFDRNRQKHNRCLNHTSAPAWPLHLHLYSGIWTPPLCPFEECNVKVARWGRRMPWPCQRYPDQKLSTLSRHTPLHFHMMSSRPHDCHQGLNLLDNMAAGIYPPGSDGDY